MAQIAAVIAGIAATLWELYKIAKTWYDRIHAAVNFIAEVIHYTELKKVDWILRLTWTSYRETWEELYATVSRVSLALGRDADFFALALRASRNMARASAALMGQKWSEHEPKWIAMTNDFLGNVQRNADEYARNPEHFFSMIDYYIDDPRTSAGMNRGIFLWDLLDETAKRTAAAGVELVELNKNLTQFQESLPDFLEPLIGPIIQPMLDLLDFTETSKFDDAMLTLHEAMEVFDTGIEHNRLDLDGLIDRLKMPGDFLLEITKLDEIARRIQESRIAQAASAELARGVDELTELAKPISMTLQALADALKIKIPPVEWAVPEVEAPVPIPIGEIEPALTWFVGDY